MSPFSVHQDPCSLKETLVQNLNEDLLLYDNGVVIAKLQETSGAWVYESVSSPPSIPILSSSSKGTKASGRRPHPTHPLTGTATTNSRKPEPIPQALEDHVQIHQVGDDIGLAVVQGLQGLSEKKKKTRSAQTGGHRNESEQIR